MNQQGGMLVFSLDLFFVFYFFTTTAIQSARHNGVFLIITLTGFENLSGLLKTIFSGTFSF